jgi:preprotein translocase subunit SecG
MNAISMLLASKDHLGGAWSLFPVFRTILCIFIAVCALFVVAVILVQPSNSSGIGAINGQSETFLSKNKGKTLESKLKKLTVIASIILAVCCILMVVLSFIAG